MLYLISTFIFWIGIFLFRRLTKTQLSAIIAIIIWHENEALCMLRPYTEFTILFASCILLYVALIPRGTGKKFFTGLFCLFLLFLAVYSGFLRGYFFKFGEFGYEQFLGLLQTNTAEALENFDTFVGFPGLSFTVLYSALIFLPFFLPQQLFHVINDFSKKRGVIKYIMLLACAFPITCVYKLNTNNYTHVLYTMYEQTSASQQNIKKRNFKQPTVSQASKDITLILVIGESATRSHMGAYGYYRNTTPWLSQALSQKNLVIFTKAFSAHSHTAQTVPLMLSQANQYSHGDVNTAPTIINTLASKGYATSWISNQERDGIYVNIISMLAAEADSTFFTTTKELPLTLYDKSLLPRIVSVASATPEQKTGKLIVAHLMGSHGMYEKRYPKRFTPDLGPEGQKAWGKHSEEKLKKIDSYDHSIAYTDEFLSKLIQGLPQDKKIALVYVSDHGESTLGKFAHDSIKEMHYDMFAIPMFVWFSDPFIQEYPGVVENIRAISQRYFTNDRIYDLLTFIESGEGDVTVMTTDSPDKTPIRHGQNTLMDLNWFKTAEQVHRLHELTGKNILLHRSNTLEKTKIARRCGFDGIEIDVTYDPSRKILVVGHDEITNDSSKLEEVLSATSDWDFKKIWIDIKNLSPENASGILTYLEKMHTYYDLKERAIIETSYGGDFIESYQKNGWFTSYYLPTIGSMEKDISGICKKGEHIRQDFSPSGLSFDIETFNEAKKICPGVFEDIPLNTWVMHPKDIDKENTITPYLLHQDIVSRSALDSILIRMDTEADDI